LRLGPARAAMAWSLPCCVAGLVAAMAMAGCAGEDPDADLAGTTTTGPPPPPGTAAPPTWRVGDWWNYTFTAGSGGGATVVVSGETSADYVMDTDSQSTAFFNAREDISYLGPVRKADLAGSQGTQRVEFLRWPLRAGENWTTTWDGEERRIEVTRVAPDGVTDLASRRLDGRLHATYTFDPAARWMRSWTFHDDAGEPAFAAELASSGGNFTGTLHRWTLEHAVQWAGNLSGAAQTVTFQVPPTATDVYWDLAIDCTAGAYVFLGGRAVVFDGTGYNSEGACPRADAFAAPMPRGAGNQTETWGADLHAPSAAAGTYRLDVWVRTLASFAVGSAPPLSVRAP
jgi:hypothetical protein